MKYYVIYDKKEMPVIVGKMEECAKFMGMSLGSLKSQYSRLRNGKIRSLNKGYKIYELKEGE